MNYDQFEKKVKNMTAHDVIMSMVDGLRNPRTEIDMDSFGYVKEGICFGCAATNAVLRIMDANKDEVLEHVLVHTSIEPYMPSALYLFELAINGLRKGSVTLYNNHAKLCGIAKIKPIPGVKLPRLENDYTEAELQQYVILAEYQLTV